MKREDIIELLRPAVIRVGNSMNSQKEFKKNLQGELLKVLESEEELEEILPDLVEMYVSEFYSSADQALIHNVQKYFGKHLNCKNAVEAKVMKDREEYENNPCFNNQINYFKRFMRKCFVKSKSGNPSEAKNLASNLNNNGSKNVNGFKKVIVDDVVEIRCKDLTTGRRELNTPSKLNAVETVSPMLVGETKNAREESKPKRKSVSRNKNTKRLRLDVSEPVIIPDSVQRFKTNKTTKKLWHYAYVNDRLGNYHVDQILKCFEDIGFVAFSMVEYHRKLSTDEMDVIGVFEKVRLKLTRELLTNAKRKLINQPNGGALCDEFTADDDLRRAVSITFRPSLMNLQILVEYIVQQFVHIGFIHPGSKAGNALGKEGLELLFKGPGLEEQVPHYDFPCFLDTNQFLSYAHSQRQKLKFDPKLDGGVSLFINHTGKTDYLKRPDGTLFIVPKYSFCILRGNVAHCGTGNSTDDAVFKFFCYIDPVQYDRVNNPYKDSVFLFDEFRQIVRTVAKPCFVKLVSKTFPYLCVYGLHEAALEDWFDLR